MVMSNFRAEDMPEENGANSNSSGPVPEAPDLIKLNEEIEKSLATKKTSIPSGAGKRVLKKDPAVRKADEQAAEVVKEKEEKQEETEVKVEPKKAATTRTSTRKRAASDSSKTSTDDSTK